MVRLMSGEKKMIATIIVMLIAVIAIGYYMVEMQGENNGVRTIVDMTGRVVKIPAVIKRAVVFAQYTTVVALGAWDCVVGTSKWAPYNTIIQKTVPNIDKIWHNGSATSFNTEEVLSLNPDIVITYGGNGGYVTPKEQIEQLENAGVPVVCVNIYNISDVYKCILLMGQIFNREQRAEQIIETMQNAFDTVKNKVSGLDKVRCLHTWSSPTKVTAGLGATHELIVNAGGVDVASSLNERYATVDIEQIIEWDPEVVLIWGSAKYTPQDIYNDSQWEDVSAVVNHQVYKYPKISTWDPEVAMLQVWFAVKIHPDAFSDFNIQNYADTFFNKIYGIDSPYEWS